jgi:hypothetical protein
MVGECTPLHQQIVKHFSKIVGATPLFQWVKFFEPPPSSTNIIASINIGHYPLKTIDEVNE